MGRRCEVQDARDVPYVVPGILGELGGRYQAHEINHALQIRRARLIRRPQRHDREEWSAWKFRRERGSLPGIFIRRSQIDEGSVDEHSTENCFELVSGPRRDDLPPPPGKSPTHERASPLSLQMDYQRWQ